METANREQMGGVGLRSRSCLNGGNLRTALLFALLFKTDFGFSPAFKVACSETFFWLRAGYVKNLL